VDREGESESSESTSRSDIANGECDIKETSHGLRQMLCGYCATRQVGTGTGSNSVPSNLSHVMWVPVCTRVQPRPALMSTLERLRAEHAERTPIAPTLHQLTVADKQTPPIYYLVIENFWAKTNLRFRLRGAKIMDGIACQNYNTDSRPKRCLNSEKFVAFNTNPRQSVTFT